MFAAVALAVAIAAAPSGKLPDSFILWGTITEHSATYVLGWLQTAKKPVLYIDSTGGHLYASMAIAQAIRARGDVKCVVRGLAASGAFAVLQACQERYMTNASKLSTHEPRIGTEPVERVGLTLILGRLEAMAEMWNMTCRQRLKLTAAEYRAKVYGRDWTMEAAEALKVGAVDRVIAP